MRIAAILVLLAACGPKSNGDDDNNGGDGGNGDGNPSTGDGNTTNCGALSATLRDFQAAHADFEEAIIGFEQGIVRADLGSDNKPVYAPAGPSTTVSGQASFDQWYRDVGGVNMAFTQPLPLTESPPGTFTFENLAFFPLDGIGFGNEGNAHNFHFTTEIHSTFKYRGGEIFTFTGDDDVFVFVNKRLGLDLGGVHGPMGATIDFDAQRNDLQITVGGTYQLDVFHAERHTTESNFRMTTTIDCFIIN